VANWAAVSGTSTNAPRNVIPMTAILALLAANR